MYRTAIYNSIKEIKKDEWDYLTENNVYMSYEFFKTFEETTVFPLQPYYITITSDENILAASAFYFEPQNSTRILDSVLLGRLAKTGLKKKITFLPSSICNRQRGHGTHFVFSPNINYDQMIFLQEILIDVIEKTAREKKTSVSFLNVTLDQKALRNSLRKRGYSSTYDLPSNFIDVKWSSFEGYKKYLSEKYPNMIKSIRHELNRNKKAGVVIKEEQITAANEKRFIELLKMNHFKHNSYRFYLKENYFKKIKEIFGRDAIIFTAQKDGTIIGVCTILRKGEEVFFSSIGVDHGLSKKDFTFFNLGYYEPIKQMTKYNVKRIFFGRGLYKTKIKRGCNSEDMLIFYKPQYKISIPVIKIWFYFHKKWMSYKLSYIKKI